MKERERRFLPWAAGAPPPPGASGSDMASSGSTEGVCDRDRPAGESLRAAGSALPRTLTDWSPVPDPVTRTEVDRVSGFSLVRRGAASSSGAFSRKLPRKSADFSLLCLPFPSSPSFRPRHLFSSLPLFCPTSQLSMPKKRPQRGCVTKGERGCAGKERKVVCREEREAEEEARGALAKEGKKKKIGSAQKKKKRRASKAVEAHLSSPLLLLNPLLGGFFPPLLFALLFFLRLQIDRTPHTAPPQPQLLNNSYRTTNYQTHGCNNIMKRASRRHC